MSIYFLVVFLAILLILFFVVKRIFFDNQIEEEDYEVIDKSDKLNFVDLFRLQGEAANKLTREEIERWESTGLNGAEAGKSYENGWTDPSNPPIINGWITNYENYGQSDYNIDPTKIDKNQLDQFYQLLTNINQTTNLNLDLTNQINSLNYRKLPITRKRKDLLISWEKRKWEIISERIKKAQTVEETEKASSMFKNLNEDFLPYDKKKSHLLQIQNERLNNFLTQKQKQIFELAIKNRESLFFTSAAGSGKSFLLKRIINNLKEQHGEDKVAVTAYTGIAAVNINGTTLHSFAGTGIGLGEAPLPDLVKKIQSNQKSQKRWQNTETLIIDEISMLDGESLDNLEFIARVIRNNNLPFGGLQLILVGDFFQLPPVSKGKKQPKFAFEVSSWQNCLKHSFLLATIHRQKEDKLVNFLNQIRLGETSSLDLKVVKELEKPLSLPNDGIKATQLYATNEEANKVNQEELEKLPYQFYLFQALDWEDSYKRLPELLRNCRASRELTLKKGAQVMLIKNLTPQLVNGSQGVVIGFERKEVKINDYQAGKKITTVKLTLPVVKFTNGIKQAIEIAEWSIETPLTSIVRASRQQIPLILSWAITIHKSQGQTIERLKIDCSKIFAEGQLYVALSRATSTQHLQVIGFRKERILCHEKVKLFYQNLQEELIT
jgi:ATP-dependent DNA helicase PIF1